MLYTNNYYLLWQFDIFYPDRYLFVCLFYDKILKIAINQSQFKMYLQY